MTDKVAVKGTLSDDCKSIMYEDDDEDKIVNVSDLLVPFSGKSIDFSVSLKASEELSIDDFKSSEEDFS